MNLGPDDVEERTDLTPEEKETSIWFAKDQSHATIHTDEAGLVRRLLKHPEATVDELGIEIGDDGEVYSFYGTIPIGCLKISVDSRDDNDRHSMVVSRDVLSAD